MKFRSLVKGFSPLNLILLIFGCIILAVTIQGHLFQLLMPAHDYEEILENGIEEGDHVKGDISFCFGKFATQETYTQYETYRTGAKTSGYYYIVPTGEYGLTAIYVRKDDKAAMDALTKETYAFLDGGADTQTVLHFNGVAMQMDKSLAGLEKAFKEQLDTWGYTQEDIDKLLADTDGKFLVLEGPADVTVLYVMAGIGLVLIALAIFFYVRRYKKAKTWEAQREEEWTKV